MEKATDIHAHEVLSLIANNPGVFDTATLPAKTREVFGDDARFYACSAANMTPEELLGFLFHKEKITELEGRLHVNRDNICDH